MELQIEVLKVAEMQQIENFESDAMLTIAYFDGRAKNLGH
jgi:hypothetical protein